ncbi:hypothetical protein BASA81_006409 [Batrachochytrium salamandrivorans]|nr:hypothetical protein BASA81_006409 [Batrachochytrium salamandrivorans]
MNRAAVVVSASLAVGAGLFVSSQTKLHSAAPPPASSSAQEKKIAFSPSEFRPFLLEKTEQLTANTTRQRFALQSPEHETGLTVASCVVAKAEIDGKAVVRPYTPISLNEQRGFVELLIKSYPAPGGLMSRHIQQLKPGQDSLEMKGPFKKLDYKANMVKKIGLVAGGTGVTPMLQVIREVLSNPADLTELSLVFANQTELDILLREELDALAYLYPNFRVYYTVDKASKGWTGGVGFVSQEMIHKRLPKPEEDCLVLVCGPKGMMEHVSGNKESQTVQGPVSGLLKQAGFKDSQVYKF